MDDRTKHLENPAEQNSLKCSGAVGAVIMLLVVQSVGWLALNELAGAPEAQKANMYDAAVQIAIFMFSVGWGICAVIVMIWLISLGRLLFTTWRSGKPQGADLE